jgi:hypothetical protein
MSGEFHVSWELTAQQLEVLAGISKVAVESGLVQKYSRALAVYGEIYKNAKPFLGDPNDPTYTLKRAVLGPQPISSPLETFFAGLVSYDNDDPKGIETSLFLIQVDSVYGKEIEGSSISIGTVNLTKWNLKVNDPYVDIFTKNDLETVMDFVVLQLREDICWSNLLG